MNTTPILGCEMCVGTAGRQGCPIHRDWTYPTMDPEMPVGRPSTDYQLESMQRLLAEKNAEIARLQRRETELLAANNAELERRRQAERERDSMRSTWELLWRSMPAQPNAAEFLTWLTRVAPETMRTWRETYEREAQRAAVVG